MKKCVFLVLMLISFVEISASNVNVRINNLYDIIDTVQVEMSDNTKTINEITKNIDIIYDFITKQGELIGKEQIAIENSLNATSLRLDIFAIIIAVVGIFLGVYINRKENKIQNLLSQVKETEQKVSTVKSDILDLNKMINNDIESIYERLKREETTTYLKRLVYEPNDIVNLISMLVSRELNINDFKYLLVAYKKSKENLVNEDDVMGTHYQSLYLIVFFSIFVVNL